MSDLLRRHAMIQQSVGDLLTPATKAEILSAYGNNVLQDAITFVNAHPAIADYVNDDPHMVCSLVTTGFTRYLKGDGYSYIDTGIKPRSTNRLHILRAYWGNDASLGSDYPKNAGIAYTDNGSTGDQGFGFNLWGNTLYVGFNSYRAPISLAKNTYYSFDLNQGNYAITYPVSGDVISGSISGSPTPSYNLVLFGWQRNGSVPYKSMMYMSDVDIYDNGVLILKLIPYIGNSIKGMLDIHDLSNPVVFYNSGTGTFSASESVSV